MVLPSYVAAVPFIPWAFVIVTNNLPTDLRLRIQKSPLLQRGITLRTMKREPPRVRPVRLAPEVLVTARSFKKQYDTKDVEYLWAALLKCYGTKERALAAIQTNPQSAHTHPALGFGGVAKPAGVVCDAETPGVVDAEDTHRLLAV